MSDRTETTVSENPKETRLRTVVGTVTSSKMNKTIAVAVERLVKHPKYGKYIRRSTRLMAHDEENACSEGDLVAIAECRPISKSKSWRLVEIVQRANAQ